MGPHDVAFGGLRRVRLLLMGLLAGVLAASAVGVGSASALTLGQIHEFTQSLSANARLDGIASGPDGNLWLTSAGSKAFAPDEAGGPLSRHVEIGPGGSPGIMRSTPAGAITEFTHGLNTGAAPARIVAGPDGDLWFTDGGATPAIGRVTPQGVITEFSHGLDSLAQPFDITSGPDGNLWFTDVGKTPAIGRITPAGVITEFTQGLGPDAAPNSIATGADGNVWFTDGAGAIGLITPQGHITEFTQGLSTTASPTEITAGPDGDMWFTDDSTPAIGKITPSGVITEYTSYFASASSASVAKPLAKPPPHIPSGIAAGPDGDVWFTDISSHAIGLMTPAGQVNEFSSGLNTGARPVRIAAGADGNMWFTDNGATASIGRVGTGQAAAAVSPPRLSGLAFTGNRLVCSASWTSWDGLTPSSSLFSFDGFRWLRDGVALAEKLSSSYTPVAADVGHRLACTASVTYPLPLLVTSVSTSSATTIHSAPVLTMLRVTPASFELSGRRVAGHCEPLSRLNRKSVRCTRAVQLTISYRLGAAAKVTFTIDRLTGGRLVGGTCVPVTSANRARPHCTRVIDLPGSIDRLSSRGPNQVPFNGHIGGHGLTGGFYRLVATPLGGRARSTSFTLLP
jgi:streptogramin lyase